MVLALLQDANLQHGRKILVFEETSPVYRYSPKYDLANHFDHIHELKGPEYNGVLMVPEVRRSLRELIERFKITDAYLSDALWNANNYIFFCLGKNLRISIYSDGAISFSNSKPSAFEKLRLFARSLAKSIYFLIRYRAIFHPIFGHHDARENPRVFRYYVPHKLMTALPFRSSNVVPLFLPSDDTENPVDDSMLLLLPNFLGAKLDADALTTYMDALLDKIPAHRQMTVHLKNHPLCPKHLHINQLRRHSSVLLPADLSFSEALSVTKPSHLVGIDSSALIYATTLPKRRLKVISLYHRGFYDAVFGRRYNDDFCDAFSAAGVEFTSTPHSHRPP